MSLKSLKTTAFLGAAMAALTFGTVSIPAFAHHSHASLEKDRTVIWEGTITNYSWKAPHVYIQAMAKNSMGETVEYTIESLNPPSMAKLGWAKDSFKKGDFIRWEGNPDRDPNRPYSGIMWAEKADGTKLYASLAAIREQINADTSAPTLIPAKKVGEGMWERIGPDGRRFPPIYSPSDDWPLNDKGKAVVANFTEDDNPIKQCVYGGPPRNIVSLLGFKWETNPEDNTITINRDLWEEKRVIHMDKNAPKGEPSSYGHSVGEWDGDALVVYTDNFVDEKWGHYTGIDSSDQKKLKERYWLSDDGLMLHVDVVVEDPEFLTEPYNFTHQWTRIEDRPMVDAGCSIETGAFYLTAGYEPGETPPPLPPSAMAMGGMAMAAGGMAPAGGMAAVTPAAATPQAAVNVPAKPTMPGFTKLFIGIGLVGLALFAFMMLRKRPTLSKD